MEGRRVASIESGLFARRGRGTYGGREFKLSKTGTEDDVLFVDAGNGLTLGHLTGSRLPNILSEHGRPRYFMGKMGTYDYELRDMGGRPLLSIHVQSNELLTHNHAIMRVLNVNDGDMDIWFLGAALMFLVKHNLPIDSEKIEWAATWTG